MMKAKTFNILTRTIVEIELDPDKEYYFDGLSGLVLGEVKRTQEQTNAQRYRKQLEKARTALGLAEPYCCGVAANEVRRAIAQIDAKEKE
jgi:hypothetical protein